MWQRGEGPRFAVAACAGALQTLAFPKFGIAGLAWVAPGLLLASALGAPGRTAFRAGLVGGLVFWLSSLYWLLNIPMNKVVPGTGWLALSCFLSLYQGAWVWLCWRCFPGKNMVGRGSCQAPIEEEVSAPQERRPTERGVRGPLTLLEHLRRAPALNQFLESSWAQRSVWALGCAAAWVALEMIQARLFSGFPWNLLGTSQYRMLPLIQIASWCGVYGVSFLVVWLSLGLWCGVAVVLMRPQRSRMWMGELVLPLAVAIGVAYWGIQVMVSPKLAKTIKMALVQPSIPQTVIWDPEAGPKRFAELMALSEEALAKKPEVLVWPEAAMPSYLRWDTNLYHGATLLESVSGLARRGKLWMILGADDAEPAGAGEAKFFNNCFLINPAGEIAGSYRKQRLVIFGEYVPMANVVPWLRTFSGVTGDFTAGTKPVAFALGALGAKTSVLICFEDVFPHGARAHVEPDTDFLINITNDGWFGEGAAQWQQAAAAVFRAVENGRPLVRCANNGLSCWIDAHGRMLEVYFAGDENIYRAGVKVAEVPLLGAERGTTIYWRNGDWFGWSCVAVAGMLLGLSFVRRREG